MTKPQCILVTGGAGFIGSNLVRLLIREGRSVVNVDKLTYAGNLNSLSDLEDNSNYCFERCDIAQFQTVRELFDKHQPDAVMHLAAESHVDRSIDEPADFIQTNVVGTFNLLQSALEYWKGLNAASNDSFRFLHISTDEVYGSVGETENSKFNEATRYDPHSPYSASKAGADHLVRAWSDTYGLPTLVTSCGNNFGPFQFPEKLIPVAILKSLRGESIPVYGEGKNIRDWIFVEDHCLALQSVLENGRPGQTYCIGADSEHQNIEIVREVCRTLDELRPREDGSNYEELITLVEDRPGHDLRYAIDNSKIVDELNWKPQHDFKHSLRETVQWYLDNEAWWSEILSGEHELQRRGRIQ